MDPCMFHGPFNSQLFLTLKLLLLLYYFDKINGSAFFFKIIHFFFKKGPSSHTYPHAVTNNGPLKTSKITSLSVLFLKKKIKRH